MRGLNRSSSKWDQRHLDRTQRVIQAWTTRDPGAAKPEATALRQAIADANLETVERHGGLTVVMEKIDQTEQETPASNGAGMIDEFRLGGSRPCRRMGDHLTRVGWRIQVVHVFGNYNTALSEGAVLPAVVEAIPGNPHWTRVGTDSLSPLR